jgi:RNA-binding protein MEX3
LREADPVFIITGSHENVAKAKWEILSAAQHFTNVRANARQRVGDPQQFVNNQIMMKFSVPVRLVGLVVGPRGKTSCVYFINS